MSLAVRVHSIRNFKPARLLLAASTALSLLAACNGSQSMIQPGPLPSNQGGLGNTPPAIPIFSPQPLPSVQPGNVGGSRLGPGGAVFAPAPMAAPGGGAAADMAISPVAPSAGSGAAKGEVGGPDILLPGPGAPQIKPEPGLLTAGAWDDIANWSFWLGLLQDQDYSGMGATWGFDTSHRFSVRVMGPKGPLADVPITLSAGQSKLFDARTNNRGEASLYLNLFAKDSQADKADKFTLTANLGQETLSQDVGLNQSEMIQLSAKTSPEPLINADLMLVVDTTGSMGDELEYLKKELQNVSQRISSDNRQDLTLRLSANFYKDTTDEYVVRAFPFTTDAATITQQLSDQSASGGGDFPEAMDAALANAVDEHQWSPTARARLLFLVCDAPSHQTPEVLKRLHTAIQRAAAKGIRVIPVASSGIDKETEFLLRMEAIATGGRYVFLTSDSGIGGSHIKPTIGQFEVKKLNDLMVQIANDYIGTPTVQPIQSASPQQSSSPLPSPEPTASVSPSPDQSASPVPSPSPTSVPVE